MFHITDLSTAEKRNLEEIRLRYAHRSEIIDELIHEIRTTYLLIEAETELDDELRLIHDTLGPVIRKEYEQSQRDGQVAARILESKLLERQQNPDALLDEVGLNLVQKGRRGMRNWRPEEEQLVIASEDWVAQEKKLKSRIKWGIGSAAVLAILAVLSLFFIFDQQKRHRQFQKAQDLVFKADSMHPYDPSLAMQYLRGSNQIFPSTQAKDKYFQIARSAPTYQVLLSLPQDVDDISLSPSAQTLAVAAGVELFVYSELLDTIPRMISIGLGAPIKHLAFVNDHRLLSIDKGGNIGLVDLASNQTFDAPKLSSQVDRYTILADTIILQLKDSSSYYAWYPADGSTWLRKEQMRIEAKNWTYLPVKINQHPQDLLALVETNYQEVLASLKIRGNKIKKIIPLTESRDMTFLGFSENDSTIQRWEIPPLALEKLPLPSGSD
ncbi:MAG: hypothetical protein AAFQ87_27120, partial [Bacteroidota bacterium]